MRQCRALTELVSTQMSQPRCRPSVKPLPRGTSASRAPRRSRISQRDTISGLGSCRLTVPKDKKKTDMILYIRRPLQGGGRQRSRDIANLGGVPCFAGFAAFGGSQSHLLHYLNAFLRSRLASWLWGSLFGRFCSLWGPTISLSSLS